MTATVGLGWGWASGFWGQGLTIEMQCVECGPLRQSEGLTKAPLETTECHKQRHSLAQDILVCVFI